MTVTHASHFSRARARLTRQYPAPDIAVNTQSDREISSCTEAACLLDLGRKRVATAFRMRSSTQKPTRAAANGTAVSGEAYIDLQGMAGGALIMLGARSMRASTGLTRLAPRFY